MIRSVDQWAEIFNSKPKHSNDHWKANCAYHVLGDLIHYFNGRPSEMEDIKQLENALEAYARVTRK